MLIITIDVLFQEYMNIDSEKRNSHLWNVYFNYFKNLPEMATFSSTHSKISDIDVFSYLSWKASSSFAQLDYSAGTRAIYFFWEQGFNKIYLWKDVFQDLSKFKKIEFAHIIAIDLMALCNRHNGKLFMNFPGENKWKEVPSKMAPTRELFKNRSEVVHDLVTWSPNGCIVTPSGIVPDDCMKLVYSKFQA